MKKNVRIFMALLLVIPALLFVASCAKQPVSSSTGQEEVGSAKADELSSRGGSQTASGEELEEESLRQGKASAMNMFLNEDVHFGFDQSILSSEAQKILKSKAAFMKANADVSIIIEGHCDERGTTEYNLALGDRRAQSVKNYLADLGIARSRMEKISYGEEMPIDAGHNESAWAKNRRAHVTIK